MVKLVYVRIK